MKSPTLQGPQSLVQAVVLGTGGAVIWKAEAPEGQSLGLSENETLGSPNTKRPHLLLRKHTCSHF